MGFGLSLYFPLWTLLMTTASFDNLPPKYHWNCNPPRSPRPSHPFPPLLLSSVLLKTRSSIRELFVLTHAIHEFNTRSPLCSIVVGLVPIMVSLLVPLILPKTSANSFRVSHVLGFLLYLSILVSIIVSHLRQNYFAFNLAHKWHLAALSKGVPPLFRGARPIFAPVLSLTPCLCPVSFLPCCDCCFLHLIRFWSPWTWLLRGLQHAWVFRLYLRSAHEERHLLIT